MTTIHPSITAERCADSINNDMDEGFCLDCGAAAFGVEPDAREYVCEACGAPAVSGAEEILFALVA
jgi:hypothetical protein